jgi:hypothetical protein
VLQRFPSSSRLQVYGIPRSRRGKAPTRPVSARVQPKVTGRPSMG